MKKKKQQKQKYQLNAMLHLLIMYTYWLINCKHCIMKILYEITVTGESASLIIHDLFVIYSQVLNNYKSIVDIIKQIFT